MTNLDPTDLLDDEELLAYARHLVASGYHASSDLPTLLFDWAEGDYADENALRQRVDAVLKSVIAAQLEAQATYPAVTDYDRLQTAFRQLEAIGYLTHENYTCCMSCGWAGVKKERKEAHWEGRTYKGAVFFHEQDNERAVEGSGLYLAHGGDNEEEVARQVVQALEAAGLSVIWNGSVDTRIHVPMTWQRLYVPAVEPTSA